MCVQVEILDGDGSSPEASSSTGSSGSRVRRRLRAGESFGENSLFAGRANRQATVRCSTNVEVLKLHKDDFEAVFGAGGLSAERLQRRSSSSNRLWLTDEEERLRTRLLGFLQMMSPSTRRTLSAGQAHPSSRWSCPPAP